MTKKEFEILCKLIDLRTTIVYGRYNDYEEITEENIIKLKQDIKEILVDQTSKEVKWIKNK